MARSIKDRTKTKVGREIEAALASLNDRFNFFLFLERQFLEGLSTVASSSADKFTTSVFSANPYARKIHVPVRDLQTFAVEHRNVTFGSLERNSSAHARRGVSRQQALSVLNLRKGSKLGQTTPVLP